MSEPYAVETPRDEFCYEKNRLKSFRTWPSTNVDPGELAKCGFYFTGEFLETKCNWCFTKISDWQNDDQVMVRHRRCSPVCPLIIFPNTCGNIPIERVENRFPSIEMGRYINNQSTASPPDTLPNLSASTYSVQTASENQPTQEEQQLLQQQRNLAQFSLVPVDLKIEANRLATFKNWPNPNVSPQSLAKAGFYYLNKTDHVRCAWCKGVIAKWEKGDNAFREHERFFPDCPRAQLGPLIEITNESDGSNGIRDLGIQQIRPPKSTKYSCLDARMRTYARWPIPDIQNPEILAQAGFYYQETEDQVRCFHCNGGLRSWQKEDDPWLEHAKWFPHCNFLKLVKGPNFVAQIQSTSEQQLKNHEGGEMQTSNNHQNNSFRQTIIGSDTVINLEEAMQSEPVQRALEMGLNEGRIRSAIRRQLEICGKTFDRTEELVEAVLEIQGDEEDSGHSSEPSSSIVREVSRILNNIFNPRNQSFSTPDSGDYDFEIIGDFHGSSEGSSYLNNLDTLRNLNDESNSEQMPTAGQQLESGSSEENSTSRNEPYFATPTYHTSNNLSKPNENECQMNLSQTPSETDSNKSNEENKPKSDSAEPLSLEEENRKLKDARTCKVCMDDEVGVVFLPCGHLVTCVQCAPGVSMCPLCRSSIKGFVRTFLS